MSFQKDEFRLLLNPLEILDGHKGKERAMQDLHDFNLASGGKYAKQDAERRRCSERIQIALRKEKEAFSSFIRGISPL